MPALHHPQLMTPHRELIRTVSAVAGPAGRGADTVHDLHFLC